MAILATSRKWLVTSLCAASRSPCSRQRFASMYSSSGSSIGNRRISSRYLVRPVSPERTGKAAVWAMTAPFPCSRPRFGGGRCAVASAKPTARGAVDPDQSTRVRPTIEMCGINAFGIAEIPKGLFSGVEQSSSAKSLLLREQRGGAGLSLYVAKESPVQGRAGTILAVLALGLLVLRLVAKNVAMRWVRQWRRDHPGRPHGMSFYRYQCRSWQLRC